MATGSNLHLVGARLANVRLQDARPVRADVPAVLAGLEAVVGGVDPADLGRRTLGPSAVAAVQRLQERAGLPATGELDDATLGRLRSEVVSAHVAASPGRTRRIQDQLAKVGVAPDSGEMTQRRFGPSTSDAIRRFQERAGLVTDGLAGETTRAALAEHALTATLSTKRQTAKLQRALLRAARIRGISLQIDGAEMKSREQGPSTAAAIRTLQETWGLPVTGIIDVATFQRATSIAASRPGPPSLVSRPDPIDVRPVRRTLSLNSAGADVPVLQRALAFLGHPPADAELRAARFGRSTRLAVLAFQAEQGLTQTGRVDTATRKLLNARLGAATPGPAASPRIRGSVRDEAWAGIAGATVTLRTNPISGAATVLGTRTTLANGFYDLPYATPTDPSSGQPVSPLSLRVTFTAPNGSEIGTKDLLNPTSIAWVNYTQGPYPYAGPSLHTQQLDAVARTGAGPVGSFQETTTRHDITRVAQAAGLTQDDVMRLVLAELAATELGGAPLDAEVCFAFLAQSLPTSLPADLLAETADWTLIDQLTDRAALGIAFIPDELAAAALSSALVQNLVPVSVSQRLDAIHTALITTRRRFALDRPLLVGNGTLRALLQASSVPPASYDSTVDTFVTSGGLGETFWNALRADPGTYGGADAVASLELAVDIGLVTKNHGPMASVVSDLIADGQDPRLEGARDMAKLAVPDWLQMIVDSGVEVPPGTDGDTEEEQRTTYARTMAAQSERLFPTVALAAEVARSAGTGLTKISELSALVDAHPTLELRQTNLTAFEAEQALDLDDTTRGELRVLQRVSRLAPTAVTARALLDNGLHSAVQLVSLGKAEVARRLKGSGVEERAALTIAGYAEFQYAQVLQRLGEFRSELQLATPAALAPQVVTAEQRTDLLGEIPDLELLFGPLDVCDCPSCMSVLGPAAYLADALRFLAAHPAETGSRTVRDVLAERRPDIGQVLLDCANTDTPLPYIDLVNELLEDEVPGAAAGPTRQTTWTAAELRAAPEYVNDAAYDTLRGADVPMSSAFDLWQEESRTFSAHLGVPRWELMDAFAGDAAATPDRADLAAEYFGISSHETGLVVTARPASAAQDSFWGFDSTRAEIPVPEILTHTQLSYQQLLLLLQTRFITPIGDPQVQLVRPADVADLDQQRLTHLSPAALERIHRMVRLHRVLPWDMWEADLLLGAERIGNGDLDQDSLVALFEAARLAVRLNIGAEQLTTWFGTLPTAGHPNASDPTDPRLAAPSAYARTYTDRAVVDPPDAALDPPSGADLNDHRPALLAALAVTNTELTALAGRTGTTLDLETLSALASWVGLARALGTSVSDLLLVADLLAPVVADPFAGPAALRAFLDAREGALLVATSAVGVAELDYLLHARPESPLASSDDAVTVSLVALRESLRTNPASGASGQVASYLAGVLHLGSAQVVSLLAQSDATGQLGAAFTDPAFVARDDDGTYTTALTPAAFPRIYTVYRRLQKMARVVELTVGKDDEQLSWLLANRAQLGALELAGLPVDADPAAPLVTSWLALCRWVRARTELTFRAASVAAGPGSPATPEREPEDLVAAAAAGIAAARTAAAGLTGIAGGTLTALDGGDAGRYRDPAFLLRLTRIAAQVARLGVLAATCATWARREAGGGAPTEAEIAVQLRSAAKAKYDSAAWYAVLTPLQDTLRERKRDALVAFLLERSARTEPESVTVNGGEWANPRRWGVADDLLSYFLVDTQMSSCALTSRIKQAIGSVQMFVQRAFLNLEQPHVLITSAERADRSSDDAWSQWKWMKSEQLWAANRNVFLYPENWITPELRDDKTPFFEEFESELQQGEITADSAEIALRHYLEKVYEVANLDVAGVYHEIEDDNPWDNLPPTTNVLHVVGRTRSDPAQYYYRTFDLNEAAWTPWSEIDVDIAAEQVVPVVYNRTLHLFWLQITEKQTKTQRQPAAQPTSSTQPAPSAPKQMEIKLAWTVRSGDGWTSRRLSPNVLVHPWQRPVSAYTLRPRYSAPENQLWLDVYISMSLDFNNTRFWDPYSGIPGFVTARRFDETARPWHSSTFVFDGQVVELRLKPLLGQYHVLDSQGIPSETLTPADSYAYVRSLTDPSGRRLQPIKGSQRGFRMAVPDGMHLEAGRFTNNTWVPNTGRLSVLENGGSVPLLNGAKPPFGIVATLQNGQFDTSWYGRSPFFYTDAARAYFVTAAFHDVVVDSTTVVQRLQYTFNAFGHPYARLLRRELNRSGPDGVLNRKIQRFPEQYPPANTFTFASYAPTSPTTVAAENAAKDVLDFSRSGAMAVYNWELFLHAPFMIACKLMANQRFEEALDWFHRVFDPTNTEALSAPQRFWITKPFFDQNDEDYRKQRIESLLADLAGSADEIRNWKNNPFRPDAIARFRPVAYQKTVVMRYLDNLIGWGDQLFRRDTIESINAGDAALRAGVGAAGTPSRARAGRAAPRPLVRRPHRGGRARRFRQRSGRGAAGELHRPSHRGQHRAGRVGAPGLRAAVLRVAGQRHAAGLLGHRRRPALQDPQLHEHLRCRTPAAALRAADRPALLVRAVAGGVDLDSVLDDTTTSGSPFRFRTVVAKANELTADVRLLGDRMLAVLDRRDAEALFRLRSNQDVALQNLVTDVRTLAVTDAERARDGLEASRDVIQARIDHYAAQPFTNPFEAIADAQRGFAQTKLQAAMVLETLAASFALIPTFGIGIAGFGGSPTVTMSVGGGNLASSFSGFASRASTGAASVNEGAALLETTGSRLRQFDQNQFQANLARAELAQLEKQLLTMETRIAIAEHELTVQEKLVEDAQAVDDYLHTKYTNTELFDWYVGQLSTVYFQAYQLAYDLARKAEQAYRFELGDQTSPAIIQFGYWDSLKQGLLAGDRLAVDLRRLESSWLERHSRRLQATTHVSLASLMPDRLLELKANGSTTIDIPEWVFAAEHPGWINARMLGVAVTVPGTTGPFVGVHATLTLTKAVVRINDSIAGGFGDALNAADSRFANTLSPVTSIVTSHGSQDRGALPGDGLADDRYTAFEGAGVVSRWTITLDPRDNAFDLTTVTDVVLSIDYEGDQGGPGLVDLARQAVADAQPTAGARLLGLDVAYPVQWHQFLHPEAGADQVLLLAISAQDLQFRFRQLAQTHQLRPTRADLVLLSDHAGQFDVRIAPPGQALPAGVPAPVDPAMGGLHHAVVTWPPNAQLLLGEWQVSVKRDDSPDWTQLAQSDIQHAWLLVEFTVQ